MLKRHFTTRTGVACNRVVRAMTASPSQVTCLDCKASTEFASAKLVADLAAAEAFAAQTPSPATSFFGEPIKCRCGHTLFRERPRSLHHFHYVCAACGTSYFPLTETGICS